MIGENLGMMYECGWRISIADSNLLYAGKRL